MHQSRLARVAGKSMKKSVPICSLRDVWACVQDLRLLQFDCLLCGFFAEKARENN
jgi:hypothetical protein